MEEFLLQYMRDLAHNLPDYAIYFQPDLEKPDGYSGFVLWHKLVIKKSYDDHYYMGVGNQVNSDNSRERVLALDDKSGGIYVFNQHELQSFVDVIKKLTE